MARLPLKLLIYIYMPTKSVDYSLYLLTDKKLAGERSIVDIVQAAIDGGTTVVQYREKNADTGYMIEQARLLRDITRSAHVPLIINDRVDVMSAIDADGVHVGQKDMPALLARKLIGSDKLLGVSVKTVEQAIKAVDDGADYLGVGDIFGTSTKADAGEPIGLEMLCRISQAVSVPIVGIGGITIDNATGVIKSGADGIAVISAIVGNKNPGKAAKQLSDAIKTAKRKRDYDK